MNEFSAFWSNFRPKNIASLPRIGFTDYDDPRIITAIKKISELGFADPILVGKKDLSPAEASTMEQVLLEHDKKNIGAEKIRRHLSDPLYQGIALLLEGQVDGLVTGATRPTADVVQGALMFVGHNESSKLISGHFLIEARNVFSTARTPFLFADCAVIPEPSPRALAVVASGAAQSFKFFTGEEPKIAFLSFSTRSSAEHPAVEKVKEALSILKSQNPALTADGEIQVDAALDKDVAQKKKAGDSPVAGDANVFIFPSLEAGNIGYKLIQRFAQTRVAGPILWGLKKPVSDLSRGCSIQEIVDTAACVARMVERKI